MRRPPGGSPPPSRPAGTGFPEPLRTSIPVNATVPAVPADRVPDILARFGRVDAVKIKVAEPGQSLDDDAARVAAVRAALPDAAIRVDANGGWDVADRRRGTDPAVPASGWNTPNSRYRTSPASPRCGAGCGLPASRC